MAGGVNAYLGKVPPDKLVAVVIAGAILLSIAWWLDRSAKRVAHQPALDRGNHRSNE
jgi:hypothetical protein